MAISEQMNKSFLDRLLFTAINLRESDFNKTLKRTALVDQTLTVRGIPCF